MEMETKANKDQKLAIEKGLGPMKEVTLRVAIKGATKIHEGLGYRVSDIKTRIENRKSTIVRAKSPGVATRAQNEIAKLEQSLAVAVAQFNDATAALVELKSIATEMGVVVEG